MDNKLQETLSRLKAGKRAGGMEFVFIDGVDYVKRSEVIALEKEYWDAEAENATLHALVKRYTDEYEAQSLELKEYKEALEDLVGWQNGPPLETYKEGWTVAMEKAIKLLTPPTKPETQ